jgi:hypothetical protein
MNGGVGAENETDKEKSMVLDVPTGAADRQSIEGREVVCDLEPVTKPRLDESAGQQINVDSNNEAARVGISKSSITRSAIDDQSLSNTSHTVMPPVLVEPTAHRHRRVGKGLEPAAPKSSIAADDYMQLLEQLVVQLNVELAMPDGIESEVSSEQKLKCLTQRIIDLSLENLELRRRLA